ncbi:hypothetical protein AC1031_006145 [Aphanomyces cochlioides]|nr:hypothetical protein AC1031_006145 [Aphanomyces cochlioides]
MSTVFTRSQWFQALNPFTRQRSSSGSGSATALRHTLVPSKRKQVDECELDEKEDDDGGETPPCSPESSPVHRLQPKAQPVVLFDQVLVPVHIPREYFTKRSQNVSGKKVPFTRRQVQTMRLQVHVFDTIREDSAQLQVPV